MASILKKDDRVLCESLDVAEAKRLDFKNPPGMFYKTNQVYQASVAGFAKLNPYVGSVSFGSGDDEVAITFVDSAGIGAARANANYEVIASIEPTAGSPNSKFAYVKPATKTAAGFTMKLDATPGGSDTLDVNYIVVGY